MARVDSPLICVVVPTTACAIIQVGRDKVVCSDPSEPTWLHCSSDCWMLLILMMSVTGARWWRVSARLAWSRCVASNHRHRPRQGRYRVALSPSVRRCRGNLESLAARNRKPIRYRPSRRKWRGTTRYIVLVRTCDNRTQNETSSTEYPVNTRWHFGDLFKSAVVIVRRKVSK